MEWDFAVGMGLLALIMLGGSVAVHLDNQRKHELALERLRTERARIEAGCEVETNHHERH